MNGINFILSNTAPNPNVYTYWVDLNENPYGGTIKFYNGEKWNYINDTDNMDTLIKEVHNFMNNMRGDSITVVRPNSITTTATTIGIDTVERDFTVQSNGNITQNQDDGIGDTITLPAVTTDKAGVMTAADKNNLETLLTKVAELETRIVSLETPTA